MPAPETFNPTTDLRPALEEAFRRASSREEFAAAALETVTPSLNLAAAAMLHYDQGQDRLSLLHAVGLDPEGVKILGTPALWSIPQDAIRNRRIRVIDSAHQHPFVPKPMVALSPTRLSIAVIPLVQGTRAVGGFVLFSPSRRGFSTELLQTVEQAVRVCAIGLLKRADSSAGAGSAGGAAGPAGEPALLRGLAAIKAEHARLSEAFAQLERDRAAEAAERVTAQSFLQAERERAAALEERVGELPAANGRIASLEEELARGERERLELQADIARLREDLSRRDAESGDLSAALQRAQSSQTDTFADGERRRTELEAELEKARENVAGAAVERQRLAKEIERAVRERDFARAEERRRRDDLEAEIGRLRAELADAQSRTGELQTALEGRVTAADVERSRGDLEARLADISRALEEAGRDRQAVEAAVAATNQRLQAAENEARSSAERLAELGAELERRSATGAEGEAALRGELEASEGKRAALERALDEARAAHAAEIGAERQLLVSASELRAGIEAERDRLHADLASLREESAAEASRLQASVQAAAEERDALAGETDALRRSLLEKDSLLQAVEVDVAAFDVDEEAPALSIDRSSDEAPFVADAEPTFVADAEPMTVESVSSRPVVELVGDSGPSGVVRQRLEAAGYEVRATDGANGASAAGSSVATVFNLATPSAWRRAAELREAAGRRDAPVFGYALAEGASSGFWLGTVEFTLLSGESATLIAVLRSLVPRLSRALSLSASDAMWGVWTQMKAAGISTAVVFDGLQAVDLLSSVRPEAAVLHLSPKSTDVFVAVRGVRASKLCRDIPLLFLFDPTPPPGEEAFLRSGINSLLNKDTVPGAAIADALLAGLGRAK